MGRIKQLLGKVENLAEVRLGTERNISRKGMETNKSAEDMPVGGLSSGKQLFLWFTFPAGASRDLPCGKALSDLALCCAHFF